LRITDRVGAWVNVVVIGADDDSGHGDFPGVDPSDRERPPALRVA
jgi:hypothetical protein